VRARIAGTGSYAPERVLTNAGLERMVDLSGKCIVERTGVHERDSPMHQTSNRGDSA
jgi:3-oxoacyl-[acyl-carrier-protein] synthase-3